MATVSFTKGALEDLQDLDGSALRLVLGGIAKLEVEPERGLPLGNRQAARLAGFRKLVVGDRQWRIVYRIEANEVVILWVIGSRVDAECYDVAIARLELYGDGKEHVLELRDALTQLKPRVQRTVLKIRSGSEPRPLEPPKRD